MRIHKEATPLMWTNSVGGNGLRDYVGTVVAYRPAETLHPYVVWDTASDDGDYYDCGSGDYCETLAEATEIFARRASWLAGNLLATESIKRKEKVNG